MANEFAILTRPDLSICNLFRNTFIKPKYAEYAFCLLLGSTDCNALKICSREVTSFRISSEAGCEKMGNCRLTFRKNDSA